MRDKRLSAPQSSRYCRLPGGYQENAHHREHATKSYRITPPTTTSQADPNWLIDDDTFKVERREYTFQFSTRQRDFNGK